MGEVLGDYEGLCALFFLESSLKTADTWYRIPLRVQGRGDNSREHYTVINTQMGMHTLGKETEHSATQRAAETEGNFEGADRPTPRHVNTRNLQTITINTSELSGKVDGPTFHGYWRQRGGDSKVGRRWWGVNPMYNVFNVDWQIPQPHPTPTSHHCGAPYVEDQHRTGM